MSNDDVNRDWNVETSTPRSAKPFKPYTEEPECEMNHKSRERDEKIHVFYFPRSVLTSRRKRSIAGPLRLS